MDRVKNRTDRLLFVFVILGYLGVFTYQLRLGSYIMEKFHDYLFFIEGIFSLGYIVVFSALFKTFAWSRKLISENSSRKKKIIAVITAVILVVLKVSSALIINIHGITDYSYLLKPETIKNMVVVFLGVSFEEILFKGGMLRLLESRLPKWGLWFLVCSLFTLMHWSYPPMMKVLAFVFQLISLLLFQIYPSIVFLSIFHFGFDIVLFL